MKKAFKRMLGVLLIVAVVIGSLGLFNGKKAVSVDASSKTSHGTTIGTTPKYIFLFIGDGMSYPQIQITSDYLGAMNQSKNSKVLTGNVPLNFMNFEVAGSAVTYDSSSFCPDSASTATSLSTGHKTYSGVINMNEDKTISYETITEKLKKQLGYKIGIISSVNLNHATPAAFYGHQASRGNYYELALEMINSNFDYFAGGELLKPDGDKGNAYDLATKAGYRVVTTNTGVKNLKPSDGKAIVIGEKIADSGSLSYEIDRKSYEFALSDYVKKGIEMLDNETGFFMMVEGGKIDWACHANDAGSTIKDTLALADAVEEALAFYEEHKDETLIIVTGDHETGGLTIGFAGTNYDTFLTNLKNQKISYAKYDSDYVSKYKENKTPFTDVLVDVKKLFGLITSEDENAEKYPNLVLTDYELKRLETAYNKTMGKSTTVGNKQEEYILYGSYEPLTVTITHILNNKSGINFSSYSHTGLPVAVLVNGEGSELFHGYYDNTEIYKKLATLTGVK